MKAAEELLLYPLMTEDHPVCPRCSSPLVLVGFQGELGKPDLSRFRCPHCGRSETFADDETWAPSPENGRHTPAETDPRTPGSPEPTANEHASAILGEFEQAQIELVGKAVILTDGKAGMVQQVWLDQLYGLRISIEGQDGKWPVSTIKLAQS